MQPLLAGEPTSIGDYQLLARLGNGAMGSVYLGRSRGQRAVAVKVARPELAEDAEFRERFRREVDMARAVGGFWTAAVVDADPEAQQPWLATEFVPGPTLHKAVVEHGPLPETAVRTLAAGLAEALRAIHSAGLVHRDLKPANVLLASDGPRVIDFGISRAVTAVSMTATGVFFGTPGFFSPEQTAGSVVHAPSDIFSLGATLAFAATATKPFGEGNTPAMLYRVVHNEPDLSKVPSGILPVVSACLNKDPDQRPTAAQLLNELGQDTAPTDQWLPTPIVQVIDKHVTQLQEMNSPFVAEQSQAGPAAQAANPAPAPKPATSHYPGTKIALHSVPLDDEAGPHAPAGGPPQGGTRVEQRSAVQQSGMDGAAAPVPAQREGTLFQERRNQPGPEFKTGGRFGKRIWWALFFGGLMYLLFWTMTEVVIPSRLVTGQQYYWTAQTYNVLMSVLFLAGLRQLILLLIPPLRLKVTTSGIYVSRLWATRFISWRGVRLVGVVGGGRKIALAVWPRTPAEQPSFTWWHWMRSYHGGVRLYRIGAAGGAVARAKLARDVRTALYQYAPYLYDPRLL